MKKIIILIAFSLLSTTLFAMEKATQTEQKTFAVEAGASISISSEDGNIDVDSWDKPEVRISWTKIAYGKSKAIAEKILKDTDVDIFHSPSTLRVKVIEPGQDRNFSFWDIFDPDTWANFPRSPVVHFRLMVPRDVKLNLTADKGKITAKNCSGSLTAQADEGNIDCQNITAENIKLDSDEGRITCSDLKTADGKITIRTDEGDIRLENSLSDRASIKCDEGKIYCSEFYARRATMTTDEGNIEVSFAEKKFDSCRLYTDEGNVTINFPEALDCEFDLKTQGGRIRNEFGLKISKIEDGQRCRESIGSLPAALVTVSVSEGNIYLQKKIGK